MKKQQPKTKYLKDYILPAYLVDTVDLTFDLNEEWCDVGSQLKCRVNPELSNAEKTFACMGRNLELKSIALDGRILGPGDYKLDEESLTIEDVPHAFTLDVETRIRPQENTSLEGLYKSSGMFCTQCEAEGFRKITYFPDRPDVMSRYSTKIIADRDLYPVLLSNGNPLDSGTFENGRHWMKWEDPFKKPSYLFALVAGDLSSVKDQFTTRSGRQVKLQIFVEKENIDKCQHAMNCLKQAMKWDEDNYDREYDLDTYMIVAVNDFNAGAMENKGLNIFNTSYVLARPETATDADFEKIQGVIAHEYFHNWTGNRITCRDWFQLSLKEGLTIFRDQQFSADMTSRTVKRIQDVKLLRTVQFAEDSGPMAHQVRPDSYIEINNFYTVTVYHKGAELIRMMHILLGVEGFKKGMDLYFERHDGQAVTTEDFVIAMEDANGADLKQFRLWYTQAGTPEVTVKTDYDFDDESMTLTLKQSCSPTPGQKNKLPFHIPVEVGLLDQNGEDLPLHLDQMPELSGNKSIVLNLRQQEETYRFAKVPCLPVVSVFRGFSAPVKRNYQTAENELLFLMSNDSDEFNRWESAQQLMTQVILRLIENYQEVSMASDMLRTFTSYETQALSQAVNKVLQNESSDKAHVSQIVALPTEMFLAEQMEEVNVEAIHHVREMVKLVLADKLKEIWLKTYRANMNSGDYRIDSESVGRRSLKNLALGYLMSLDDEEILRLCIEQYETADNMTDEMNALAFLANKDYEDRQAALGSFYGKWQNDPLVLNIWLSIQSASKLTDLDRIKELMEHPAFELKNPNKLRALIGTFCTANLLNFHVADGGGYEFLTDQILKLDPLNPQIAARLLTPLTRWKKYDPNRRSLMRAQIERILKASALSRDVFEIASKSLE
ncbi:MAG: aminopeptidase N [Proteobacteria bacterium]|nr:aminopeptidase N [Pseudomonadota bacterium]